MLLQIKVRTNQNEFFIDTSKNPLVVNLTKPPQNNQANIELIKQFSSLTGCSVKILRGQKSMSKLLELDLSKEKWEKIVSCL